MSKSIQRHFTATGIVIDEQQRVLLIFHRKLGVWLPPGGHVEPNETPDKACLREIREETGITAVIISNGEFSQVNDEYAHVLPTPYSVLLEDIYRQGVHFHIDFLYRCCPIAGVFPTYNERETKDVGWFPADALPEPMYHNAREVILQALRDKKNH